MYVLRPLSARAVLDGRGDSNRGIRLGDNVILGDRATLRCKDGDIVIGNNVGIGLNSSLSAVGGNVLVLADQAMIGPGYPADRCDSWRRPDRRPSSNLGALTRTYLRIAEVAWRG